MIHLFFVLLLHSAFACNYDIGRIDSNRNGKIAVDYFLNDRHNLNPYSYFSDDLVIYYGDRTCFTQLSRMNIIDTSIAYENYFNRLQNEYGLHPIDTLRTTRYSLYITNTGLDPYPPDPQSGISGYAGDYFMALFPDVIVNIVSDPSVLIHEIGHSLLHIPQRFSWMEESICQYFAHTYVPNIRTIYDVTSSFLINNHYLNIFGRNGSTNARYNYGAFWKFIEYEYKSKRYIGNIVNNIPENTDDIWNEIARILDDCDVNLRICNSNTDPTTSTRLIVRWVMSLVQLDFWRHNQDTYNFAERYIGNNNYFDRNNLVWFNPTITDINLIDSRVEKGGFEVLSYGDYILPDTYRWRRVYITHYTDGTFKVSRFDTTDQDIRKKLIVIIRID